MTTRTLLTPVSITATGRGADLDVSGLTGRARVILTARNTAGTSPTLACKLQGATGLSTGFASVVEGSTDNKLFSASTTANALAAQFTQSGARQIKKVFLMLKKNGTITAGKKLTLKLKTNNSGDPSSTVLGTSDTVDIDTEVTTSYVAVPFTFATPVDVADATIYHVELTADYSADGTNNVTWRSSTVVSGGNFEQLNDTTWADTTTKALEVYAQEYNFADLTSGTYTTLSTASNTTVQTLEFHARSLPKFMSLYSTVGGTSNPAFAVAAVVSAQRTLTS